MMATAATDRLEEIKKRLDRWECVCGARGGMVACADHCPGDVRDVDTLRLIYQELRAIRDLLRYLSPDQPPEAP